MAEGCPLPPKSKAGTTAPATSEVESGLPLCREASMLPNSTEKFAVLYLLSGKRRVGDLRDGLVELASGRELCIFEVDVARGRKYNLLAYKLRRKVLAEIAQGRFHAVVASPPCSTFSRARCAPGGPPR